MQEDIEQQLRQLHHTRESLKREIDTLRKEIDDVRQDNLGFMNRVKKLAAEHILRMEGMDNFMTATIHRLNQMQFEDAKEYIDHLNHAIEEAHKAISEIDGIIPNLESISRDRASLQQRYDTWVDKARLFVNKS